MAALDLRCSVQARTAGVGATGTAASAGAFLLVEVPLPWPREITEHEALAGVQIDGRVQGVVPSPARVAEGTTLVVEHRAPDGWFRGYERREAVVPLGDLAGGCAALAGTPVQHDDVVDLLVCTHGTRDRCCGSMGTALFSGVASRPGLRVARTSHTGGHRFAPTAVVLPQGTAWAWLDDALLDAVLDRSTPPAELVDHYRGSVAAGSPPAQVAEAAVFAEVGWSWLDTGRTVDVVGRHGDRSLVRVASDTGDAWVAIVEQVGTGPQAVCGELDPPAPKHDPVLRLVELRSDG